MPVKSLMAIAMLAGLLVSSAGYAADQPDELTITREFFTATTTGAAARESLSEPTDAAAARKLMKFCAMTPSGQMPRLALKVCEAYEDWRRAYLRWGRDAVLEMAKVQKLLSEPEKAEAPKPKQEEQKATVEK